MTINCSPNLRGRIPKPLFAALARRHLNLVYSVALRDVGNTHAAEEISQAVFIILAQKAKSLSSKIILSGWLYQTTRLTAANFLRDEIRRQKREQEAYMQSTLNETNLDVWPQIAPLLDDALAKLGDRDRNAIVLRFFEQKSAGGWACNERERRRGENAGEPCARETAEDFRQTWGHFDGCDHRWRGLGEFRSRCTSGFGDDYHSCDGQRCSGQRFNFNPY